jgi:hypothetical protein
VLLAILIARKYNARPSAGTRAQLVVVGLAAVGSKETAAVAALLVLVDAWARRTLSRELWLDCGILLGIVGLFAVVRLATAFGTSMPPLSRYLAQRALFGSFGALAVPWHVDVIERLPWVPLAGGVAVVALAAAFFVDPAGSRRRTRQAVAGAVCTLLPIVPIFPILYIAPDLQQSRYLYMSGFGWAALVALAASERGRSLVSFAAVSGLVALGAYGTTLHLRPWNAAALLRDRVETSARQAEMERCEAVVVSNLPDSVDGAYVFRNGGAEAFARDLQLDVTLAEEGAGPCSFRWNEARLSFVRSAGE